MFERSKNVLIGTAALLVISMQGCATGPRTEFAAGPLQTECVVLIHGLNRSYRAMQPMAAALQDVGFSVANVD